MAPGIGHQHLIVRASCHTCRAVSHGAQILWCDSVPLGMKVDAQILWCDLIASLGTKLVRLSRLLPGLTTSLDVQGLLTRNPRDRMTAAKALDHPWVREGGEASEEPLDNTLVRAFAHEPCKALARPCWATADGSQGAGPPLGA